MAHAIGRLLLVDPQSHDHVEMLGHEPLDHAWRARRIIGGVAIDQHVDVGIDIGKHSPDHMAFALPPLAAHLGAGRARDLDGAILRIVVIDVDGRRRQRLLEVPDHGGDGRLLIVAGHQHCDPHRW